MTKQNVYENKVAHLLEEAMQICKDNDIPFISTVQLDEDLAEAKDIGHINTEFVMHVPNDTTTMSNRFQAIMGLVYPTTANPEALN